MHTMWCCWSICYHTKQTLSQAVKHTLVDYTHFCILWSFKFVEKLATEHCIEVLSDPITHFLNLTTPWRERGGRKGGRREGGGREEGRREGGREEGGGREGGGRREEGGREEGGGKEKAKGKGGKGE